LPDDYTRLNFTIVRNLWQVERCPLRCSIPSTNLTALNVDRRPIALLARRSAANFAVLHNGARNLKSTVDSVTSPAAPTAFRLVNWGNVWI
jgi:hypothetical protein